jgi:hypothetical protein
VATSFDNWASQNGLSGADALPTADPDKDGYTNRQEYAFGADPKAGTRGLVTTMVSGSNMTITWLERRDLSYKVQSTADLATTSFVDDTSVGISASVDQTGVAIGYTRKQFTVSASGRRFYRVCAIDGAGN